MTCNEDAESIEYVDDDVHEGNPEQLPVKLYYEVVRTGENY